MSDLDRWVEHERRYTGRLVEPGRDEIWDALVAKFNEDEIVDEEDALERLRNTDWENRT
jgi:hypothetical protein